jgi:hypothetical protein
MSLLTDNSRARSRSAGTASLKKAKAANFAIFSSVRASCVPKLRRARGSACAGVCSGACSRRRSVLHWQNRKPYGFGRRAFLFVLYSCQSKKRSPCPARRAEHTSPPRILSAAIKRRFRPRNRRQDRAALQGRGHARSPAPALCAA